MFSLHCFVILMSDNMILVSVRSEKYCLFNKYKNDLPVKYFLSFQNTYFSIPTHLQFLAVIVPRKTVIRLANGKCAFTTRLKHYRWSNVHCDSIVLWHPSFVHLSSTSKIESSRKQSSLQNWRRTKENDGYPQQILRQSHQSNWLFNKISIQNDERKGKLVDKYLNFV